MPARVLYLSYQPEEGASLDVRQELADISDRLAQTQHGHNLELVNRANLPFDRLPAQLDALRPEVLHITAHGEDGGRLVLLAGEGFCQVEPEQLVALLSGAGPRPRLVVLNACHSAPLARRLAAGGVLAIGATRRVPSRLAALFSGLLYEAVAQGKHLADAFSVAQAAAMAEDPSLYDTFLLAEPPSAPARALVLLPPPPPVPSAELAPPPLRVLPHQVLLHLDAYDGAVSLSELEAWMEPQRELRVKLRLSEHMRRLGLNQITHPPGEIDWIALGQATQSLVDAALAAIPDDGRPVDYFIGGNAPHAVFAHVGYALSNWRGRRQILLHRNNRKEIQWVRLDLGEGQTPVSERFFNQRQGLDPERRSNADGQLGLYLGALGREVHEDVAGFFRREALPRAGLVALLHTRKDPVSGEVTPMSAGSGAAAAAELQRASTELCAAYPDHDGLVLFIDGPDFLGFLAGRALNPRQIKGHRLSLTWFDRGRYTTAYTLPLPEQAPPRVPQTAEALLQRRVLYDHIRAGVEALRSTLIPEDLRLPAGFGPQDEALPQRLCRTLGELRLGASPEGEVFELSVHRRELRFGEGLVHALAELPPEDLGRFGRLLLLHELLHEPQQLGGAFYRGIGRAGVVLEDLDYQADAFALLSAVRWEVRERGARGAREAGWILQSYLDTHLMALAAFDKMEQGVPLLRLPERRLRRYLIWSLQAARAETVTELGQVEALLRPRLLVELAPLRGRLDPRGDKLVRQADADTQLFVSLEGRLLRHPRLPENFEPAQLLEQVRALDLAALRRSLGFLVEREARLLSPWSVQ